jgi:hypothetical protein
MISKSKTIKSNSKGLFLLELIIAISIFSSASFFPLISFSKFVGSYLTYFYTVKTYQFLHFGRAWAIANDQDTHYKIQETHNLNLYNQNQDLLKTITFPPQLQISLNKNIGFKSSGNTKRAGTVTISSKNKTRKITLGVGYGKITIKD